MDIFTSGVSFIPWLVSFFILGTIIGSFLNVVILRIGTSEGLTGRSHCSNCNNTLAWFELIPIFSFLLQRGRCRHCKCNISFQYILVEIITGLVFAVVYAVFGLEANIFSIGETGLYLVLSSILIAIFFYDLKHLIIPNVLVYPFILLTVSALFVDFTAHTFILPTFLAFSAGPILFGPFFGLWFFSRGKWMGFGDGKLALGIGFSLGLYGGVSALLWAFWIGALVSLSLMAISRGLAHFVSEGSLQFLHTRLTMKSEIPFGPFLIIGWALVAVLDLDVGVFVQALSNFIF